MRVLIQVVKCVSLFQIHVNSIDVKIVLPTRFLKLTPPAWLPSPCLLCAG